MENVRIKPTLRLTTKLTQADVVVLSLLLERPMHGYDLVQEYERQEVRDWASVSKAQVYYALTKLEKHQFVTGEEVTEKQDLRGKTVYFVTKIGKSALQKQLLAKHWIVQRRPQPFTTWAGLSIHLTDAVRKKMYAQRLSFLEKELIKENASYAFVSEMTSDRSKVGLKIITLTIAQIKTEIAWINEASK